ncbi:MAG: rhomboid family intramembrane serine protease [Gammaproteobacteria bacterium]|nr:rhomboid family intramembrane serine protease [Gammaproteobacteria bacterium]
MALTLQARGIPYAIPEAGGGTLLLVPAEFAERAKHELWLFETENRRATVAPVAPAYQESAWGVAGYVVTISIVAILAAAAMFNRDWLAAGRIDGALVRQGEWWRTITALTLHSGLPHFLGNLGFGALFGVMAGRVIGPGVTWLAVLIAASVGNFVNTLLLDPSHRAVGASTAVFAALGLVAGFAWRARLYAGDRWAYRTGPIVGGIALLAFTGTGGENTDIGAHLAGFVFGLIAGVLLVRASPHLPDRRLQQFCGAAAIAAVALAWIMAL